MASRGCFLTRSIGRVAMVGMTLLVVVVATNAPAFAAPQNRWPSNSTEKRRTVPDRVATKAGSLIRWETDIDAAFKKSATSGKPVFWYVPRLRDTFMDRVKSLDIYMKAGPFSWPQIIEPINRSFIPLVAVPDQGSQRRFNLQKYRFIEPGFLVVATGTNSAVTKVIHRTDRLTTLHIPWLEKMITGIAVGLERSKGIEMSALPVAASPEWLEEIRQAFRDRDYSQVVLICNQHKDSGGVAAVERDLRLAMATFRLGKHQSASSLFAKTASRYPDHSLGHKAAAEAQGIGPFVRGFEIHSAIPESAMKVTSSSGVDPARPVYRPVGIRRRCVDFLLAMQDESGGVFDSDYDFGGTDSLPNVHVAVTAIAGMALLEQLQNQNDPQRRAAIESAVVRAARFTADNANLAFTDRDEIFWALAYRLEFWAALHSSALTSIPIAESAPVIERCLNDLVRIQTKTGSWFHEYANPFVTATGVMSLNRTRVIANSGQSPRAASALGNAVQSLARHRQRSGSFPYKDAVANENLMGTNIEAAAGRMPLCEAALFVGGGSSIERLQRAIATSFQQHQNLDVAYKYDNHTDHWNYGGFFFWFDMRGRKQAIELLPASEVKARFEQQLEAIVISKSEIDGCYVDSHEIGRCYGTAMALMCLKK